MYFYSHQQQVFKDTWQQGWTGASISYREAHSDSFHVAD